MESSNRKPSDYVHIMEWGRKLGSFGYFIEAQQEEALEDNAPLTAVYKNRQGKWVTLEDIKERENAPRC